jgi:hypothetical protein
MKQRAGCAVLVGAIIFVLSGAAPAAAASGTESFGGVILTSGRSGTRTVLSSAVLAKGVFNGVGHVVEIQNLPSDPDNVERDDLVFDAGSLHLLSTVEDFSVSVDPTSCVLRGTVQQTEEITGGTGQFAGATGTSTASVHILALAARNPDGTCSEELPPLWEIDTIASQGTLSF